MKALKPGEDSVSPEISQHQQGRGNWGRHSVHQTPPRATFCSKTLPPDFLATLSQGEDSTRAGDNSSLFSPPFPLARARAGEEAAGAQSLWIGWRGDLTERGQHLKNSSSQRARGLGATQGPHCVRTLSP